MSSAPNRIFLARLIGQMVFDPAGDQVGKLRDVVVLLRAGGRRPRVLGLVIEVLGTRRIFLPMTRVTSLDSGQIITTGVLNMRRFNQRATETLVLHELFDREVTFGENRKGTVFDVAMEQDARHDWTISHVALVEGQKRFSRRGSTQVFEWDEVSGLVDEQYGQGAYALLSHMDEMRPTDLANALRDITPKRRAEIVAELEDERLADVLEELSETIQVEIFSFLDQSRAARVLEEMQSDDAADLIQELPPKMAEDLLNLMEPEEAEDVRRLLIYPERTAGGLMSIDPVILGPEATVADALALVREPELAPALASMVFVARPPLQTPTGRFLGVTHIQALLREPPSKLLGSIVVNDLEWPRPETSFESVTAILAAYNLVACAVVDENGRLVGAVSVDDVLEELLPADWRDSTVGD